MCDICTLLYFECFVVCMLLWQLDFWAAVHLWKQLNPRNYLMSWPTKIFDCNTFPVWVDFIMWEKAIAAIYITCAINNSTQQKIYFIYKSMKHTLYSCNKEQQLQGYQCCCECFTSPFSQHGQELISVSVLCFPIFSYYLRLQLKPAYCCMTLTELGPAQTVAWSLWGIWIWYVRTCGVPGVLLVRPVRPSVSHQTHMSVEIHTLHPCVTVLLEKSR